MELQERVEVQRRGRGSGLVTADRGDPGEQEERGDEDVEERQRSKGLCRFEVVPAGIRMGHKRLCKERVLEKARESVTNTHVKFYKPNSCFYASRSTATLKNTFTSSKLLPKKNNTSVLKY